MLLKKFQIQNTQLILDCAKWKYINSIQIQMCVFDAYIAQESSKTSQTFNFNYTYLFCVCSFICIFQLFVLDIHFWYSLKDNSISRSMRGWSWSYDNCEGYTAWLTDIPPQSKSHKLYVIWVFSQCVPVLLWVVFTQRLIDAWSRSTRLDI